MLGKIFIGMLCVFLLLGAFAVPISNGIKGWRTDDITENKLVTTGSGVTSANVVLSRDLYQANTGEVTSITSTIEETPVASSYTEATKTLLVTELEQSQSRTLTIEYNSETEDTTMRVLGPFLSLLIFGGILAAIVYGVVRGRG